MKNFAVEVISLMCFLELLKVASSDQRPMDIIDNFIGLAEPNNDDIEKRNWIVDGGVFVPYKSTTIVHKSRLVPVTYGFVIKKETLKDNPALYKLGVKLLDEKVEPSSKQLRVDGKKIEMATMADNPPKINSEQQELNAKSNCVKGSKVLRLLAKLGRDISEIEQAILAQNQGVLSKEHVLIAKSLKKKERGKPRPQQEAHVSGHKGMFEKDLNLKHKKPYKQNIPKNLSRYWQCRRSHTKKKCDVLLQRKHFHSERERGMHPTRHKTTHNNKFHIKHRHKGRNLKHNNEKRKYSRKHNSHGKIDSYNGKSKHSVKYNDTKYRDSHKSDMHYHSVTNVSANHTKQESRKKHDKSQHDKRQHWHSAMLEQKHVLRPKSKEKQPHNDNNDFKRSRVRFGRKNRRIKKWKKKLKKKHKREVLKDI